MGGDGCSTLHNNSYPFFEVKGRSAPFFGLSDGANPACCIQIMAYLPTHNFAPRPHKTSTFFLSRFVGSTYMAKRLWAGQS